MPRFSPHAQGTNAWLKERLGHLSASRMNDAMDINKKGESSAARRKYMMEMIAERMDDTLTEKYVTQAMMDGIEREPLARDLYEEVTGNLVTQAGFCFHDTIEYFGASVDGLVGSTGLVEIKCCTTPVHLEIVLAGQVPEKHKKQMATQCLITQREWCDFVAFSPVVAEPAQIFIKRYVPTKEELKAVEDGAIQFLSEIDQLWERLMYGELEAETDPQPEVPGMDTNITM